ncbi:MAG: glycoside hydrolase family 15 protein [Thermoplasmata archaeon]
MVGNGLITFNDISSNGYAKIRNHGMIANNRTAALVSLNGTIDWACLPDFDSLPIFSSILDKDKGGYFSIAPTDTDDMHVYQYYEEYTNILVTEFIKRNRTVLKVIDFMPASEYSTIYFPEIHRLIEAPASEIELEIRFKPVFNYGRNKPLILKNENGYLFRSGKENAGIVSDLKFEEYDRFVSKIVTLKKNDAKWLVMVYGEKNLHRLKDYKSYDRLEETTLYWKKWINQGTYNGVYSKYVTRSALVLKALFFEPTGMVVAAPTSSLPESLGGERNWDYRFMWIRDASYIIESLSLLGYKTEATKFLYDFIDRVSGQKKLRTIYSIKNSRQLDEVEIGEYEGFMGSKPVRFGNKAYKQLQLDQYGAIINAIYHFHKIGGLVNAYLWDFIIGLLDELTEKWSSPDSSIWEFRTRKEHYVYSKVMAWVGFERAIEIGKELQYSAPYDRWKETADKIKADILLRGYNESINSFVQFYDSNDVDGALLRLPILGFLPVTDIRIKNTIKKVEEDLMFEHSFFRRYNNDDGLRGVDNMFLLLSFWYTSDLILMGDVEKAKSVFEAVLEKANHIGLFSEEVDIQTGELMGNFPQALTHLGVISAAYQINKVLKNRSE